MRIASFSLKTVTSLTCIEIVVGVQRLRQLGRDQVFDVDLFLDEVPAARVISVMSWRICSSLSGPPCVWAQAGIAVPTRPQVIVLVIRLIFDAGLSRSNAALSNVKTRGIAEVLRRLGVVDAARSP